MFQALIFALLPLVASVALSIAAWRLFGTQRAPVLRVSGVLFFAVACAQFALLALPTAIICFFGPGSASAGWFAIGFHPAFAYLSHGCFALASVLLAVQISRTSAGRT